MAKTHDYGGRMTDSKKRKKTFFEFFAGGGMARLGLGAGWECLFANDFDRQKADVYVENFGNGHFHYGDVGALTLRDLPATAPDLVWASFPCQDLSLAGARRGLDGARSGVFHAFWSLMRAAARDGRGPRAVVLENVAGLLTSNGGADFRLVIETLAKSGYAVSALVLDAAAFTPQSRRRVFIFGFDPAH
ncbi:MAG: DNA cytosine methyltransferase, partial [Pseudomonadota bacterium]